MRARPGIRRLRLVAIGAALVAIAATAAAHGAVRSSADTGTLELRAVLTMVSGPGVCPPGAPESVECHAREGEGLVPGLGKVSQSYIYHVGVARPECPLPDTFRVFGFPARLVVEGKGTLEIAVADTTECFTLGTVLNPTQSFTITGGTGSYAGASGGGSVKHEARFSPTGARGYDTWTGTLVVPGVEFDVTAPVLSGAKPKTVLAPPRAKSARVRFTVTAQDTVDGSVPVTCQPRSGSRFKLGKTRVTCATTDRSANTATTKFTITVKARR